VEWNELKRRMARAKEAGQTRPRHLWNLSRRLIYKKFGWQAHTTCALLRAGGSWTMATISSSTN
jgi:hypothetical protein